MIDWMLKEDRGKFVKMVDLLKEKVPFVEAVRKALGKPPERLDKDWRDYVRANY